MWAGDDLTRPGYEYKTAILWMNISCYHIFEMFYLETRLDVYLALIFIFWFAELHGNMETAHNYNLIIQYIHSKCITLGIISFKKKTCQIIIFIWTIQFVSILLYLHIFTVFTSFWIMYIHIAKSFYRYTNTGSRKETDFNISFYWVLFTNEQRSISTDIWKDYVIDTNEEILNGLNKHNIDCLINLFIKYYCNHILIFTPR